MCFKNQKKKRESSIQDWRKAKEKEKTPNQRLEESKKKKKKNSIKDQKKEKEKYTERSLDQTTSE